MIRNDFHWQKLITAHRSMIFPKNSEIISAHLPLSPELSGTPYISEVKRLR